jgi:hypothetical protein
MNEIYLNFKQSQDMLLETFENAFKREVFNQINWDYRFSGLI